MYVKQLRFENFRNLVDGEIEPYENINVIYGENAQGKTNLLEAIWLFTGGHSFRGAKDIELQRIDRETGKSTDYAKLLLDFYSEEREQKAILNIERGRRSSVINGVSKKTGSALIGKVCAVIFSPEHLLLVKEGPSKRRNFIDGAICQIKPAYTKTLSLYNRSLLQRNTLLKDLIKFPKLTETLDVWNLRLARFGAEIVKERLGYIKLLQEKIDDIYYGISSGKEKMQVSYSSSFKTKLEEHEKEDIEDIFLSELRRTEKSDIRAGFTTIGTHRDDMEIEISGMSARMFGSQGQQRSAVLAMKLAEAEIILNSIGEAPLILLDDVMSELDKSRQDYLLNHLEGKQVFITCCDPSVVDSLKTGRSFNVAEGRVRAD